MNFQKHNPVISLIPYLNARPLVQPLTEMPDLGVDFVTDTPAISCRKLGEGEVDAGLVSSIAIAQLPAVAIVDQICIASEGPVESVLLFSEKPLESIRTVSLDPASRTSNTLIEILARMWLKQPMTFHEARTDDIWMELENQDAVLAIGDRAFHFGLEQPSLIVMDLAMEWKHFTGLPFVFAVWGLRNDSPLNPDIFRHAGEIGLSRLEQIADQAADEMGSGTLDRTLIRRYLSESLHYRFASRERKSLFLFYRYARELGLIETVPEIRFV